MKKGTFISRYLGKLSEAEEDKDENFAAQMYSVSLVKSHRKVFTLKNFYNIFVVLQK